MSVYVDPLFTQVAREPRARRVDAKHRHQWCHLLADSTEELIAFAKRLGMKREWFQDDNAGGHFDLVPTRRELAVKLGAVEVTSRELVAIRRRRRAEAAA